MPVVVTELAKVAEPDTVNAEVPVDEIIDGDEPFITSEPTVTAPFRISRVAPVIVSCEILLPKVPLPDKTKVPPEIVVGPEYVLVPVSVSKPEPTLIIATFAVLPS